LLSTLTVMPGNNCVLPFCIEDWGFFGFGLFAAIAGSIFVLGFFAIFVRCRFCFHNRGTRGIMYGFKPRRDALVSKIFVGTRVIWMQQQRQGESRTRHWDSSGHFTGTSNSTHHWQESVPVRVNVYEYFYECPDCRSKWSRTR
jgi:hypothetical protein